MGEVSESWRLAFVQFVTQLRPFTTEVSVNVWTSHGMPAAPPVDVRVRVTVWVKPEGKVVLTLFMNAGIRPNRVSVPGTVFTIVPSGKFSVRDSSQLIFVLDDNPSGVCTTRSSLPFSCLTMEYLVVRPKAVFSST